MRLGYNTNGFAHHRIEDAIEVLAEIGYRSVGLTLEPHFFDPPDIRGVDPCVRRIGPVLDRCKLSATIETGSRYILDPRRKHQPTLISGNLEDRRRRVDSLVACVEIARRLGAESVSLWSGSPDDQAGPAEWTARLKTGLLEVLDACRACDVRLAFEPEPGMLVETMRTFGALHQAIADGRFGLALDVGHVFCLSDGEAADHIRQWKNSLWNVHLEDMRRGAHEHLMFGDGNMEFPPVFRALQEIQYRGPVHVELSRHSHDAVNVAMKAFAFLRAWF